VVDALAGAGKTSTALLAAQDDPRRQISYVAFNRPIADEAARRFPNNTTARTSHSFAFRSVMTQRPALKARLDTGGFVPAWKQAQILRLPDDFRFGLFRMRDTKLATLVSEAVTRFCHSAEPEPQGWMIPKVPGLDTPAALDAFRVFLLPFVQRAWEDLKSDKGQLRFHHDVYLKIFSLSDYCRLPGDLIIMDEAQDINPVTKLIVDRQNSERGAQILVIGDTNQQIYCQPISTMVEVPSYGMRTVIRRIDELQVGDKVVAYKDRRVFLTGRPISSVTRFRYTGDLVRATTDTSQQSEYTEKHHVMVRFGDELRGKHAVYIMRRGDQYRVGRVPFVYETVNGAFGLKLRLNAEGADAGWILSLHDTAEEAALEEALVSARFNIPDACFVYHGSGKLDNVEFWKQLGSNAVYGESCLSAFGRLADYPLFAAGTPIGLRSVVTTAAANLMDGMRMLPIGETVEADRLRERRAPIQSWRPVIVTRRPYDDDVISLEVEDCHTYFADGILTHNSWRGAVDSLNMYDTPHRLPLTKSFRFGSAIADEANRILEWLDTPLRVEGHDPVHSVLGHLDAPDTVLTRTNAAAIGRLMESQLMGVQTGLVGGTQQVEYLAKAALDLTLGRPTTHPDLIAFDTWRQVQEYVEDAADAGQLKVLVKLVDTHGAEKLLDAVAQAVPEQGAELLISTAHKAKGKEWDRVQLAGDFPNPEEYDLGGMPDEELRLAYVAVTRAKEVLDSSALSWLADVDRTFLAPAELPERAVVVVRPRIQIAQLMIDPESDNRVIMQGTPYSKELVAAQKELLSDLPGSSFRGEWAGFAKVRVVLANQHVLRVAQQFGLTISDEARERIEMYS
jgi:hypothetical protein